jgi:hypothetical protein
MERNWRKCVVPMSPGFEVQVNEIFEYT